MESSQARSTSQPPSTGRSVRWALNDEYDDPSASKSSHHSRQNRRGYDSDTDSSHDGHRSSRRNLDKRTRPPRQDSRTPSPAPSDETIDLPERFDEQGRPKDEDPLADTIQNLLGRKGGVAKMFLSLTDGLVGNSDGVRDDRRRRR